MTAGDRFKAWIDSLSVAWGDRLKGWMSAWASKSILNTLDDIEPELLSQSRVFIETIRDTPGLPPETKAFLNEMLAPKSFGWVFAFISFVIGYVGQISTSMLQGYLEPARQASQKATPFHIPDLALILDMKLRQKMESPEFYDLVGKSGWSAEWADRFMDLKHPVMPSALVLPAWLRDKAKYKHFVDDLPKLGLTPEQIELLTEMAYQLPSFRDVVGFLAHEVLEPQMIAKYGLDDEWGGLDKTLFEKVGLKEDMALNYWRDHWQHASYSQVIELLHRGVITEQDVYDWYRLIEIPPYWRDKLTSIMYNLPGRIEIRMMAQYGLVTKAQIMELLRKDGLAEEYVEVVADMNIVRGVRSDIQTRYTKGWLNSDEVRAEIALYNLSPQIAERMYQWIVKNAGPERTAKELDLTKAEIVKGVKTGIISWDEGIQRLVAMGYDAAEAAFIMAINIEVVVPEPTSTITVQTDTIRRQRRQRLISKEVEVSMLIAIGLDAGLAIAYADNDDLRLVKEAATS